LSPSQQTRRHTRQSRQWTVIRLEPRGSRSNSRDPRMLANPTKILCRPDQRQSVTVICLLLELAHSHLSTSTGPSSSSLRVYDAQICPPNAAISFCKFEMIVLFRQNMVEVIDVWFIAASLWINSGHKNVLLWTQACPVMCYLENLKCHTWQLTVDMYILTWMSYFDICHHPYICFFVSLWLCTTMSPVKKMPNCIV